MASFAKAFADRWRTCGRGWVMIALRAGWRPLLHTHWPRFRLRL
jgi:hypothetical protein